MRKLSQYEEAHLIISAVRVLEHTGGKTPSFEDIGKLLGMQVERVSVICGRLKDREIVDFVTGPFENTGVVIDNYMAVEDLERETPQGDLAREIKAFKENSRNSLEDKVKAIAEEKRKKEQELFAQLQSEFKAQVEKTE